MSKEAPTVKLRPKDVGRILVQDEVTDVMHERLFAAFAEDVEALSNLEVVLENTEEEDFYEVSVAADGPGAPCADTCWSGRARSSDPSDDHGFVHQHRARTRRIRKARFVRRQDGADTKGGFRERRRGDAQTRSESHAESERLDGMIHVFLPVRTSPMRTSKSHLKY